MSKYLKEDEFAKACEIITRLGLPKPEPGTLYGDGAYINEIIRQYDFRRKVFEALAKEWPEIDWM